MMIPEAWENHAEMDDRPPRLLPLPLHADGGLGRPGARGVHRRLGDRRGARPQRPAARPLLGHRGRSGRPGLRGRRAGHRPVDDRAQGPPRARPHVPRRHRRPAHRRRRRDQGRARRRAPLRRVAARRDGRARRPAVAVPRQVRPPRARAPPADLRLHRRGGLAAAAADGARAGPRPPGSMGNDAPLAPFSSRSRLLFDYFIQLFAQVTNPPLDAYREELVTSLQVHLGSETNLLDASPASCRRVVLPLPVVDDDELAQLAGINDDGDMPGFAPYLVSGLYDVAGGGEALRARLTEIREEVSAAVEDGARVIILTDRHSDADHAPIPSLLLTGAVHHHLVREKTRTRVDLVVEAGDVRETHHVSLLLGYGASAVNPYLALDTVDDLIDRGVITGVTSGTATRNVVEALAKGVRKVMSEDGRLDGRVLRRRADLRGDRPGHRGRRGLLRRHHLAPGRRGLRRPRRGGRDPPPPGLARGRRAPRPPRARGRRRVPVAPRGRAARVQPAHGVQAPALHAHPELRHVQGVHPRRRRAELAADDAARAVRLQGRRRAPAARRSRSTRSSRSPRSSSASTPAPSPTGRSRRRCTRSSRSR